MLRQLWAGVVTGVTGRVEGEAGQGPLHVHRENDFVGFLRIKNVGRRPSNLRGRLELPATRDLMSLIPHSSFPLSPLYLFFSVATAPVSLFHFPGVMYLLIMLTKPPSWTRFQSGCSEDLLPRPGPGPLSLACPAQGQQRLLLSPPPTHAI